MYMQIYNGFTAEQQEVLFNKICQILSKELDIKEALEKVKFLYRHEQDTYYNWCDYYHGEINKLHTAKVLNIESFNYADYLVRDIYEQENNEYTCTLYIGKAKSKSCVDGDRYHVVFKPATGSIKFYSWFY